MFSALIYGQVLGKTSRYISDVLMRAWIIFITFIKKYENETKTNNTIVSPLILHIIADGIKNNVVLHCMYSQLYIVQAKKHTSAIHIIPTLEKKPRLQTYQSKFWSSGGGTYRHRPAHCPTPASFRAWVSFCGHITVLQFLKSAKKCKKKHLKNHCSSKKKSSNKYDDEYSSKRSQLK